MTDLSALTNVLHRLNFKLADASPEYISRRKRQMVYFLTASAATIFTARFAYRTTITRQYIPTLFQGNHQPPLSYNFAMDAAVAVGTGTMLCGTVSSMIAFGTCWVMDVLSLAEFGWRMKAVLGGHSKEQELAKMAMDLETMQIQNGLNDLLEGKLEFDFDEIDEKR
ncbi:hypothetical protein METSCH_C00850 [Metschnikowia aff. pulcherrima]|uniref:Altered inheritance of mitochondria protein 11 n=1 Tax=Metschnikowia aff. pulcherrima TaxID=2163413 RepID=A0A4P6XL71_9ASCO|nr:hypothetical protein METSCH_C00850 [Metschnikowia aff. pulcherrima]